MGKGQGGKGGEKERGGVGLPPIKSWLRAWFRVSTLAAWVNVKLSAMANSALHPSGVGCQLVTSNPFNYVKGANARSHGDRCGLLPTPSASQLEWIVRSLPAQGH